jgi:hypothetical protein
VKEATTSTYEITDESNTIAEKMIDYLHAGDYSELPKKTAGG